MTVITPLGPASWRPEVQVGTDPKWYPNALRFATRQEAADNVRDLEMRWFAVTATRVMPSEDPVNHRWVDGALQPVGEPPAG
jgi:hypothetical protein